jgi:hypothetical protein
MQMANPIVQSQYLPHNKETKTHLWRFYNPPPNRVEYPDFRTSQEATHSWLAMRSMHRESWVSRPRTASELFLSTCTLTGYAAQGGILLMFLRLLLISSLILHYP